MTQAHNFDMIVPIFCHYKLQSKYTYIESIKITLRVFTYISVHMRTYVHVCTFVKIDFLVNFFRNSIYIFLNVFFCVMQIIQILYRNIDGTIVVLIS